MQYRTLATEGRNRTTWNLDTMSALELVTVMNHEDLSVPRAVRRARPQIAQAVELISDRLAKGGRMFYVGAGTSGRIGALDASEVSPTFGVSAKMVQFVMAGGEHALARATEASEDSVEMGRRDLAAKRPAKRDVVVGIAASGVTPYTLSALNYAGSKGAATVAVVCNRGSAMSKAADVAIEVEVGPEVLSGSSRLKAGTAQKLICNMLTTGAMARLGYVYSNLMVNLHLKNKKLTERGIQVIELLAGVDRAEALAALEKADMNMAPALVMIKAGVGKSEALRRLRKSSGNVRKAIEG